MNKLTIIGNLTRDPELRTVSSGVSVCDFTVAVNRRGSQKGETDYFRVTAWRGLAENCAKYLAKGRKVCVIGPVSGATYQANDGSTRMSLEVTAEDVEFLSSRNDGQAAPAQAGSYPAPAPQQTQMDYTPVEMDEIPF